MIRIYAVYDLVAFCIIGNLLTFPHDAPATPVFTDVLQDPATSLAKHPGDYSLVCLGSYNDKTGELEASDVRTVITGQAWLDSRKAAE